MLTVHTAPPMDLAASPTPGVLQSTSCVVSVATLYGWAQGMVASPRGPHARTLMNRGCVIMAESIVTSCRHDAAQASMTHQRASQPRSEAASWVKA